MFWSKFEKDISQFLRQVKLQKIEIYKHSLLSYIVKNNVV